MRKLFIDDERFPAGNREDWVICRSSAEAIAWVKINGLPDFISFDHDLGGEDTSRKFINWLVDALLDEVVYMAPSFKFDVHSQNPIGAMWIRQTMDGIVAHFR